MNKANYNKITLKIILNQNTIMPCILLPFTIETEIRKLTIDTKEAIAVDVMNLIA